MNDSFLRLHALAYKHFNNQNYGVSMVYFKKSLVVCSDANYRRYSLHAMLRIYSKMEKYTDMTDIFVMLINEYTENLEIFRIEKFIKTNFINKISLIELKKKLDENKNGHCVKKYYEALVNYIMLLTSKIE